ncbi:hypothetical protein [Belliella baltica]|nr:hypothetical protein [Belliella baltica]
MKHLLIIFFLTLSFNCLGQKESRELVEVTAQKVGIKNSAIFFQLAVSQEFENDILIVIPEIAEEGEGYMILTSNIILTNKKSGTIKAKFRGEKEWFSDAVRIDQIEIEPSIYKLNETNVAFGLKVFYANQSRPNPSSITELSLYAFDGEKLNVVLKEFPISHYVGKTDTTCIGTFEVHTKELKISNTYTNQHADLEFVNSIELYEQNENCEKIIKDAKKEVEILKYESGRYKKFEISPDGRNDQ